MATHVATWFAIVVGGTGGTLAALSGSHVAPATSSALPLRAPGKVAAFEPASAPLPATTSASPAASATLPAGSASAEKPRVPLPAAELLPLPSTKQALLRAEMNCDQRKAESCIVAARSYESGSTVATDPAKAARYRKIALTAWLSGCDHNSAAACLTLASMYRAGTGVPQSDRNADALVRRARELCRFKDAPACHDLTE